MPLLDPDTGNPMTVDATEDSTTTITVVKEEEEDDDEATIGTVEVEAPAIISSHEDQEQPKQQPRKKGGLLGRFRRRRKEKQIPAAPVVADKRDQTPSPKPVAEVRESSGTPGTDVEDDDEEGEWVNKNKNDVAVLAERESLKQVRFPAADAMKSIPIRQRKIVPKAPTARESAFGGPPRYDWIDIETSAAIKVQAVARRNKAMKELEKQGITTAAIRNRSRRRAARMNANGITGSADIPNLFACCGVGLAFGESTEEHHSKARQHQREQYLERKKEKQEREEQLRKTFLRMSAQKKASHRNDGVEETFEVVEEEDEDGEEEEQEQQQELGAKA